MRERKWLSIDKVTESFQPVTVSGLHQICHFFVFLVNTKTHIKSRNEWCPSEVTGWASPYCRDIRDSMMWKGGGVLSIERCQAKIVMTGPQRGCWEKSTDAVTFHSVATSNFCQRFNEWQCLEEWEAWRAIRYGSRELVCFCYRASD